MGADAAKHTLKTSLAQLPADSEVCQYVADMALELRGICKNNNENYLAYLLEIVFIEANSQASSKPDAV